MPVGVLPGPLDPGLLVPPLNRPLGVTGGAAPLQQHLITLDRLLQFDLTNSPAPIAFRRHAERDVGIRHSQLRGSRVAPVLLGPAVLQKVVKKEVRVRQRIGFAKVIIRHDHFVAHADGESNGVAHLRVKETGHGRARAATEFPEDSRWCQVERI